MRNTRFLFWIIVAITVTALLIDLPGVNIKFNLGPFKIDTRIGGYRLDLFGGKFSRDLEFRPGLDLQGGMEVILSAEMKDIPKGSQETALESARSVIERRINLFGVAEPNVQTSKVGQDYRIIVELPGISETERALDLIGRTAQLDFKTFDPEATKSAERQNQPPYKSTGITGRDLRRAYLTFNTQDGAPEVGFELTDEGGKKFKAVTEQLVSKTSQEEKILGIFLDDQPISLPTVQAVIADKGVISGNFTTASAKDLVIKLNAGALPVPIKVISQGNIGASLGQESVQKSILAGLVGLSIVFIFMVGNYGRLGFIADISLFIYGILTLALYKLIPIVITLPGIAGFLLSVGMAVDANILIFERMKEELRAGKPIRAAMELGFGRAWNSIRDANMATLITCFILFNPLNWSFLNNSGMVRGFALTLALGIFIGLFTGIVVSRTLIRMFYKGTK